jgi:hypothetical protein
MNFEQWQCNVMIEASLRCDNCVFSLANEFMETEEVFCQDFLFFLDVLPCSPVDIYRPFGKTHPKSGINTDKYLIILNYCWGFRL